MAKKIDKIIKENFEEIFVPLTKKLLKLEFEQAEEIPDDLQITLETQPDFLKKVKSADNNAYILHIEFQSSNDVEMAERMLLYYSMLYKKYRLPIYQQIFYLGSRNSKFQTAMEHEFLTFRYNLVDFKTIPYREFLQSDKPEEIILAILGDFEKRKATEIAEQILRKINTLKIRNEIKLKSVKQLEVLSGLRNLQEIIDILIPKIMPLEYDITKDIRYKQGQEKGLEIGEAKEKKIRKKLDDVIIKFLKNGNMSIKEIAEFTNVSQAYVRKLAKSLEMKG